MIKKVASSIPGYISVSFELPSCLWADRIFLVGDFNQWDENATPMLQERDGIWRATLDLPLGNHYEFRYLIDGQWMSDSHADGFASTQFGISNSLVCCSIPVTTVHGTDRPLVEQTMKHGRSFRMPIGSEWNHRQAPTSTTPERSRFRLANLQTALAYEG